MIAEKIKEYEVVPMDMTNGGTSLKGYLTTTYDKLLELLGKPTYTDADPYAKVNCEWVLDTKYYEDGYEDEYDYNYETVTIYNWKDGHIPMNECQWHVGGKSYNSQDIVDLIINGNISPVENYNS